jgi:hypothetical protein
MSQTATNQGLPKQEPSAKANAEEDKADMEQHQEAVLTPWRKQESARFHREEINNQTKNPCPPSSCQSII